MPTIININYGSNPKYKEISDLEIGDYFLNFSKLYRLVNIEGNLATVINIDSKEKDNILVKIYSGTTVTFVDSVKIEVM
jgi:hypothetical protein